MNHPCVARFTKLTPLTIGVPRRRRTNGSTTPHTIPPTTPACRRTRNSVKACAGYLGRGETGPRFPGPGSRKRRSSMRARRSSGLRRAGAKECLRASAADAVAFLSNDGSGRGRPRRARQRAYESVSIEDRAISLCWSAGRSMVQGRPADPWVRGPGVQGSPGATQVGDRSATRVRVGKPSCWLRWTLWTKNVSDSVAGCHAACCSLLVLALHDARFVSFIPMPGMRTDLRRTVPSAPSADAERTKAESSSTIHAGTSLFRTARLLAPPKLRHVFPPSPVCVSSRTLQIPTQRLC